MKEDISICWLRRDLRLQDNTSFGQVRCFDIRNKLDHSLKYGIRLESGALMIMKGDLQVDWEHRIAKNTI